MLSEGFIFLHYISSNTPDLTNAMLQGRMVLAYFTLWRPTVYLLFPWCKLVAVYLITHSHMGLPL